MKAMKYLSMLLMMMTLSVCMVSCDKEEKIPELDEFTLPGTRWTYTDKYEEDDVQITVDYTITFSTATATYDAKMTIKEGNQTQTASSFVNYAYNYSDGLVVFTPTEAGKAYLEGEITSNIKMVVTNISTGEEIGTFYKQ